MLGPTLLNRSFVAKRSLLRSSRFFSYAAPVTGDKLLPDRVDTVVVGGGIVGTSIAYHLAKQSDQKVLLLEKTELTAGTTWHSVGLVTLFHPGINTKRLHWYSINFYNQLENETGQQLGYHQPGSIRIASTPSRVDEMRYQMARQGWNQAPQCLLTPDQVKKQCPVIDQDKVLMGLYTPHDGYIDPYSLTQGIAKGARMYGAQIFQNTQVTGLEMQSDGTWYVQTPKSTIKANRVVNASGFWGKEIGKMAGIDIPLVPMEHQYVVTKSVPEIQALDKEIPVLRDLDGSSYIRQERDGILVGCYELQPQARSDWSTNGVPPEFGKELYPPEIGRLESHLHAAMELIPCFGNAEIQSQVNGPITYSPDILPMVGPTLMPNMWLAVGFSYGIVHAGGVGKYLADWILNGEPEFDLIEFDPLRYGTWATNEYAIKKCTESYRMNNSVGYPHEERLAGRPTNRINGIYEDLKAAGAFMGFHSGWEQPDWYAKEGEVAEYKPSFYKTNYHHAIMREYHLVSSKVGLADITPFGKFIVKGVQAREFLERLVAGVVPKEGRTSLAHALTPGGKVMAEFTITRMEDGTFMLVTGGGSELHDLRHMEQVRRDGNFNVDILNITDETGVLSIAGPNSRELLSRCLGNDIDDWKFLDARKCSINGVNCRAIRISYTGELGWEIYMPINQIKPVYDQIMKRGKDLGIGHFGTMAINVFRLEKGFKMWGAEMNLDCSLLDAGLGNFAQWKRKTGFIGKESLLEEKKQFKMSKLLMLEIDMKDSRAEPEGNLSVWLAGRVVGNMTSGCYSPAIGKGLGYAYLPPLLDFKGAEVEVELMGEMLKARVLGKPPVETEPVRSKNSGKKIV